MALASVQSLAQDDQTLIARILRRQSLSLYFAHRSKSSCVYPQVERFTSPAAAPSSLSSSHSLTGAAVRWDPLLDGLPRLSHVSSSVEDDIDWLFLQELHRGKSSSSRAQVIRKRPQPTQTLNCPILIMASMCYL